MNTIKEGIQAQELRIGNWVQEEVLGPVKVSGYHGNTVYVTAKHLTTERQIVDREHPLSFQCLSPIPITSKMAEKSGFEYVKEVGGYANKNHLLYEGENGLWTLDIFCCNSNDCHINIRYVHELQNLCYPLGEELTINL